jgi:predicted permease
MNFWRRQRRENDLDDEIRSHLQMAASERVERGESPALAATRARKELGNIGLIKEITREMWGWASFERLLQDLRFGFRILAQAPAFATVAIVTLALGIGANTALFSVLNGVLLKPLAFREPDRLVTMYESKVYFEDGSITYPNYLDWQRESHSFSQMAAFRSTGMNLTGMGESERVKVQMVSAGFFSMLGVPIRRGREFTPEEDLLGAGPVALISEGLWKRKYGASKDVLKKSVVLDGHTYSIVGIVPSSFHLESLNFETPDAYVPIGQYSEPLFRDRGTAFSTDAFARLKPGVTLQQARLDMKQVTDNLAAQYPTVDKGIGAYIIPLKQDIVGNIRPALLMLFGAVGFVLLIACVNVASLMLARSMSRSKEFAVRVALGATRARVVRQLLTESMVLSVAGGVLGVMIAAWGTQAMVALLPQTLPRAEDISLDGHVLLFTLAVTLLAGTLFGLAPALKISRPDLHDTLKESGRGASGERQRAQGVFVVAEMSLALVLLIGAGLMVRSFATLSQVNPGFNPHGVLRFAVALPAQFESATPDATRAALRQIEDKIRAAPGVESTSFLSGALPMEGDSEDPVWIEGQPRPASENDRNWALWYEVDPDYLAVMQIPLLRGRFFNSEDNLQTRKVAVIDEDFAAKYLPNQDPIGTRIGDDYWGPAEVVGVIGHVRHWGLDDAKALHAQMYFPQQQTPDKFIGRKVRFQMVLVRTTGDPKALVNSLRRTVEQQNSGNVFFIPEAMDSIVSDSLRSQRFSMILLGVFAALALVLSSIGIYGVISYLVGRRTHEIAIRMAIGAQPGDVLKMVVRHGAKLTLIGVAIGLTAALGLTWLMSSMLYGVAPSDPITFFGVAILLTAIALAACYIPARRATRVDPMAALRYE